MHKKFKTNGAFIISFLKHRLDILRLKLKFLKVGFRKKLAIGIITAVVAVGGVFTFFQTRAGATTFTWLQETWSGGQDQVNLPRHGVNQTGWTKFWSKDTQISTSNDELKITQTDTPWTETDDASGFSAGTKSNTYSSGTGILLKKNNGVSCTTAQTTDYECTAGNCDADFSSGNYCHATASSCPSGASEYVNTYNLCSANSYYKNCANSVWGSQVNSPDTANDYCDAGGGAQSGYDLLATCASGIGGGFTNPACTSCSPYLAASTSSCKTTCASASDCWSGFLCISNACVNPCNGATTVYNGKDGITYSVVAALDGKCWLKSNLGTATVATAYNDSNAYGWLYQWGRLKDGHQIRTSGTTNTRATGDVPGHANFIYYASSPYDWRNPQNDSLSTTWGGVNGTSSPCPTDWRIPTQAEWATVLSAEGITNYNTAFSSSLKLPAGGYREGYGASLYGVGSYGAFWSSTVTGTNAYAIDFDSSSMRPAISVQRVSGDSIRCIKN